MISKEKLKELLQLPESETVDFKREPHRLDNDHYKSKLLKDIIAMANTPREESAYIVIGVKSYPDGTKKFFDVSSHPDDSDLHPIMSKAKVEPQPTFLYQPLTVDGRSFGVIEIPIDEKGPFYATCDYGVLKAYRLYFRRGTINDEADSNERKKIHKWFSKEEIDSQVSPSPSLKLGNWDELSLNCHHFDKNRLYLLILGPKEYSSSEAWRFLARLPFSLVLDFDHQTVESGVYSIVAPAMKENRSVHLWTLGNESSLVPDKACYWYAARGITERETSLCCGDWRKWNRKYGKAIDQLIQNFVRASGGRPLTVITTWYAPEYVREVCSVVDRMFGDSASYVFAVPEADRYQELSQQFAGKLVSVSIEEFLYGIARNLKGEDTSRTVAAIPRKDGSFCILERAELVWLSEDMEVLHSNVELNTESDREVGYDYLRGARIGWSDLAEHYDAEREATSKIKALVERDLESRKTTRVNLYHWPGAGGTTVARRVAWDLRRIYPVVCLQRTTPGETISRLREIYQKTGSSTLVVTEGADTTPNQLEQLYTEVTAENIPAVFLSVLRRFEAESRTERTVFLGQNLELIETRNFMKTYSRFAPNQNTQLKAFLYKEPRQRTPFLFALTAFGRDFIGLTRYVESRLKVATASQKELMVYLSLAYYYGHKSVLPQIFAAHLGKPEDRPVHLNNILDEPQLELLIPESDGKWRPIHQLIAEEILKIVLSGSSPERRNWKRSLTSWGIEFIKVCHKGTRMPSDDLIDLLRRVFILRDEYDLLGTEGSGTSKFSKFIEDIQTNEGKLSVLKALVEFFPNEPHFWGHLGRFYSKPMREPDKAIEALDNAINISAYDPVLYHMKGMCYRQKVYDLMNEWKRGRISKEQFLQLQEMVEAALTTFKRSRELDNDGEHAHISPIQLLIRVLDFGFSQSECRSRAEFLGKASSSWYREKLDEAEGLLEDVRAIREGENPSQYAIACEANLSEIYDDYSRALQDWGNLLGRQDVYAPPIRRQIVRTYLARRQRDWLSLEQSEIERIVELMEDNLREEPESEFNLRLWFQAVRYSYRQNIDVALDRLAQWKATGDSQDAYYYLYILHVLKALEGSTIEKVRSEELIEQSAKKARNRRNRTRSFEWFGDGHGLERLVHYSELGGWDKKVDFYSNTSPLVRLQGIIAKIRGPEAGAIEINRCGLLAFFVPAKANAEKGRDENQPVSFYLGFSYDGLRAWSVKFE